ncbi:MAG TPA: hypothetical protein VFV27_02320 [Nevskiaceae bacterium]|nr:hypothetical protein [Nevskiaceae bacterium]
MSTQIRHFVLTLDGRIREFSAEQAARVAAGAGAVPDLADARVRYLQVVVDDGGSNEIRIQTAGASLQFDSQGRIREARAPKDDEQISRFEHDAVVQWTLRGRPDVGPVFH